MTPVDHSIQVSELLRQVTDARLARHRECTRFLSELTPRLRAARKAERERERHLAPRFNVFRYLREDELGLSRIIADLLDPTGAHGQGTSFLEAMLDALPETRGRFGGLRSESINPISVAREHCTTTGRFIDVTVDIPTATGRFCLAFENKPYASDQHGQVKSYLKYLREEYGTRFLLVYLPPVHRWPDEDSLPRAQRALWPDHFRIMPYTGSDISLKNWFATCRKLCNADRVSWLLSDAEVFCQQRFGESTMTTNPDTRFVRTYLSNNPSHMSAALAVHDAWRLVRVEMCKRFLEHLRNALEDKLTMVLPGFEGNFGVKQRYGEKNKNASALWITRDAWLPYDDLPPDQEGRNAIMLQSEGRGRNGWYWGVSSPKAPGGMTPAEQERHKRLCEALLRHGLSLTHSKGDWWAQWEYAPSHRNWDPVVPELYEECEAGGGPITTFFVDGLVKIARHAIPAIDEVEMVGHAGPGRRPS